MTRPQRTLAEPVVFRGVGVHTGVEGTLRVLPAPEGHGRLFLVQGRPIPARVGSVVRVDRCTTLGDGDVTVSTVEHVLSAAAGLGLDNLVLELSGPEIPILDGSALPFVEGFLNAGLVDQGATMESLALPRPVFVAAGEALVLALPAPEPSFEVSIQFAHPLVGLQQHTFLPGVEDFRSTVAPARTFGFWEEVQALLARGLARGGDLSNALVIGGPGGFSSPPRFPDEPVRHKVLDLVGDLALLGVPLDARVLALRAGHGLHVELARRILEEVTHAECVGNRSQAAPSVAVPAPGSGHRG